MTFLEFVGMLIFIAQAAAFLGFFIFVFIMMEKIIKRFDNKG